MMYWSLNGTQLHQGHVIDVLRSLAAGSVQLVVTSPPYWSLRDYNLPPIEWEPVTFTPVAGLPEMTVAGCAAGCDHVWGDHYQKPRSGKNVAYDPSVGSNRTQQGISNPMNDGVHSQFCQRCHGWRGCLGLEPDPWMYVGHLVAVFREVRRVLRDDGCAFVNLGDSYASSAFSSRPNGKGEGITGDKAHSDIPRPPVPTALKPKDLIGIPWRVAFALQADGWWLRSDVIWQKPNCMPESVTDRPTKSHEHVFLMAKSKRYFWDQDAVKAPLKESSLERGYSAAYFRNDAPKMQAAPDDVRAKGNWRTNAYVPTGRNIRTVWTIPTASYPGAHFATFPPALVRPMIKAGTSERGVCPGCGSSWTRVTAHQQGDNETRERPKRTAGMSGNTSTLSLSGNGSKEWAERGGKSTTIGWIPTCSCYGIEMPPKLHLSDMPDDARAPFMCEKCEGTGLEPSLPLMPDLETPCRKCKGQGERWGNAVWLKWKAECDEVRRNRLYVLGQIRGLDLPTVPATILDPFAGSGTTAEVAIELGRKCILIEQSKAYCDEQIIPRLELPIAVRLI